MKIKILILLCFCASYTAFCQVIRDPVTYAMKAGQTYYKWVVDINHNGIDDILISKKASAEEIEEEKALTKGDVLQPDAHGFGVYIGIKGGGYINSQYVESPDGKEAGGVTIDVSQCYVGYVDEIKQWGIVTVEYTERRKSDRVERKIIFYTINGDHIKEVTLDKSADANKPSAVYDKYLSESKRTKVQLQEVKP